jgi:hypothetical protein
MRGGIASGAGCGARLGGALCGERRAADEVKPFLAQLGGGLGGVAVETLRYEYEYEFAPRKAKFRDICFGAFGMMMGDIAGIDEVLQAIWQSLMHVLHGNGTPAAAEDQTSKLLQKLAAAAERDGYDEGICTQLANMMAAVNNRKGIDSRTAPSTRKSFYAASTINRDGTSSSFYGAHNGGGGLGGGSGWKGWGTFTLRGVDSAWLNWKTQWKPAGAKGAAKGKSRNNKGAMQGQVERRHA